MPQTPNKKLTGAEAIIKCLLQLETKMVFGYPGGAIMPLYDALFDFKDELRHVLTRHEQGAIHAAQGYARVSGNTGVVFTTSGPGATNLVTGLMDASMDSTPLVCITGQVNSGLLGSDAFQEADVIGTTLAVSKWSYQIKNVNEIQQILHKAFMVAQSGRPGPVVIDITKDVFFDTFNYQENFKAEKYNGQVTIADSLAVQKASELIQHAKKPLILFGQGVLLAKAEKEFKEFVEKTGIPAAWTILGKSALASDHPQNIGMLGMHGNYAPNIMTSTCDLMIGIGLRFDDRVTGNVAKFANQAKVIHFDIDPSEFNKVLKIDLAVRGDLKETLNEVSKKCEHNKYTEWYNEYRQLLNIEIESVFQNDLYPKSEAIKMGEVIQNLNEITQGKANIITDVGQHQMTASRYVKVADNYKFITSGGAGTMGFGLPAAIGACLESPEKTTIAIIGDGGFQMTIQELGTIMEQKIPLKIILLNNQFLGMVRQWQDLFFDKRYSFTEMTNPDFIKIADSYGIQAKQIKHRKDLINGLKELLENEHSYLLEIKVEKEDNVFPMVPAGASVSEIRLS